MQTRQSLNIMNDAFGTAFALNQDVNVTRAVRAAEAIPGTNSKQRFLLTKEESIELVAKLGIFLNGDTDQVKELLAKA